MFAALSLPFHSSRIAYSSNNHIRYKTRGDRGEAKYENFDDATISEKFITHFIKNGSKCGALSTVSLVLPKKNSLLFTGELRKELHIRLGLPLDRPLLRISNALTFGGMGKRVKSMSRNGIHYAYIATLYSITPFFLITFGIHEVKLCRNMYQKYNLAKNHVVICEKSIL